MATVTISAKDLLAALVGDAPAPTGHTQLTEAGREFLATLSLDSASFYGRYGKTVEEILQKIDAALKDQVNPTLGGLQRTAVLLASSVDLSADVSAGNREPGSADYEDLTELLKAPEVITTLRELYGLTDADFIQDRSVEKGFRHLDWDRLTVHRVGTTSMILKAESTPGNSGEYVLKLVHFMFQGVAPIQQATIDYCEVAEAARRGCPNVARVHASGPGWILEEYIPGVTLGDHLKEYRRTLKRKDKSDLKPDYLRLMGEIYLPLVRAIASLHVDGNAIHADLTPSNIILQNSGNIPEGLAGKPGEPKVAIVVRLVDIGRNLLASDVIGRVRSPDAHFVAPEVAKLAPSGKANEPAADYYSLGLLLPVSLGISDPADLAGGRIPDAVFEAEPLLARVMADLADPRPDKRLSTLRADVNYPHADLLTVVEYLGKLQTALLKSGGLSRSSARVRQTLIDALKILWSPISGLGSLAQSLSDSDAPQAKQYRHLARWARIAVGAFTLSAMAIALSLWLRYGAAITDPGKLNSQRLPDLLKNVGINMRRSPNARFNESCAVGFSFAFAVLFYYLFAFSRADFRNCEPATRLRRIAEVVMRLQTISVLPFVVVGVLYLPDYWLGYSALGMSFVGLNNFLVYRRQVEVRASIDVDPDDDKAAFDYWKGPKAAEELNDWIPTMFLYVTLVAVLFVAIEVGAGHDLEVYAVIATTLNFVFFGVLQAIRKGPEIDPSLTRTMVFAERWEATRSPSSSPGPSRRVAADPRSTSTMG